MCYTGKSEYARPPPGTNDKSKPVYNGRRRPLQKAVRCYRYHTKPHHDKPTQKQQQPYTQPNKNRTSRQSQAGIGHSDPTHRGQIVAKSSQSTHRSVPRHIVAVLCFPMWVCCDGIWDDREAVSRQFVGALSPACLVVWPCVVAPPADRV